MWCFMPTLGTTTTRVASEVVTTMNAMASYTTALTVAFHALADDVADDPPERPTSEPKLGPVDLNAQPIVCCTNCGEHRLRHACQGTDDDALDNVRLHLGMAWPHAHQPTRQVGLTPPLIAERTRSFSEAAP